MIKLYENIKKRRIELNLTQEQLAALMGYSDKTMISKIEKGAVDLSISKVVEFANVLNINPRVLMGWEEPSADSDDTDSEKAELLSIYDDISTDDQSQLLKIAKTYLPEE